MLPRSVLSCELLKSLDTSLAPLNFRFVSLNIPNSFGEFRASLDCGRTSKGKAFFVIFNCKIASNSNLHRVTAKKKRRKKDVSEKKGDGKIVKIVIAAIAMNDNGQKLLLENLLMINGPTTMLLLMVSFIRTRSFFTMQHEDNVVQLRK